MKYFYLFILLCFTHQSFAQTEKIEKQCACCSENHKNFDFWIGEWTVTDKDGKTLGHNSIEKIQDNCILRENWTGARGGYTGTSYNFYNNATQQWEQVWIDNNGGNLYLRGNPDGNKMILRSADLKDKDGNPFYHRITWTKNEDGTVRQLWETIKDGKDTTVAFDGLYTKTNQ